MAPLDQPLAGFVSEKAGLLLKAGIDQAVAEIEIILCHLLDCERLKLYLDGGDLIDDDVIKRLDEIIDRRTTRYPLQYILGEAYFYSRPFTVNEAVMGPTPETELLCENAARFIRTVDLEHPRILDIGTGSGVIAVTCALEIPGAEVVAVDISEDALAVAQGNAAKLGAADRIEFRPSDMLTALSDDERFDLILSNPPYICDPDYDGLPPEVLADPKVALVGGSDGLDAVRHLMAKAPRYLAPGGRIMFEIGYDQAEAVTKLAEADDRYRSIIIFRDLADISRVVVLACGE